jgi:uncharacterized integral membrane protein (TIGR00698 family)
MAGLYAYHGESIRQPVETDAICIMAGVFRKEPDVTVRSQAQISFAATEPIRRPTISEDWLAVIIAFAAIGLVLAGIRPAWPAFDWTTATDLAGRILSPLNLARSLIAGVMVGLLAAVGAWLMGATLIRFAAGFGVLYALTWLAQVIAGSTGVSAWGLEYVIFALVLGLVVSNVLSVPAWLREAARSEYYIKIGLVFLGASILFGDIMRAGLMGLAQAVLVVTAVWFVSFWVARRFGIDDELATMLSAAVSICGISAAIAACGAIQGDRKKLSYVTSLVLVVAVPMMVLMPHTVRTFGIPDAVGGAWLGGTLDTSASVVAAGELVSDTARDAGVVVKLSQNVLIGVAAFLLTVWWAMKKQHGPEKPSLAVIWERFPKFVLGFLAASFIVSFVLAASLVNETKGLLTGLRTMWFGLAFTSIGLETRFLDLMTTGGGRPAAAFLIGQCFNLVWTLLLAYAFFGGLFFAVPVFN